MVLFGKKKVDVCAICGKETKSGFFSGLFKKQIEGEYVCNDCYGEVYLPQDVQNSLTLDSFREYMAFRDENQILRDKFEITETVDLGAFEEKLVFDMKHGLMCTEKNLKATIFEASNIKSFTIREDRDLLFEGNAQEFHCHISSVPDRVILLEPSIEKFEQRMKLFESRLRAMPEEKRKEFEKDRPRFNELTPFEKFHIVINFDHPYWKTYTATVTAPMLDAHKPDIDDYINAYKLRVAPVEQLANALANLAFPNARQVTSEPSLTTDSVKELQRYRALHDAGLMSDAEYNTKRRQLLNLDLPY